MEESRYYELEYNNLYCVHFANKQALSLDQIKDIFSEWGTVVNIGKAGDDYGFRFVKYHHEEEVKRCIEALRNHRTIRLLPKKPRNQNDDRKNGQNTRNNGINPNEEASPNLNEFHTGKGEAGRDIDLNNGTSPVITNERNLKRNESLCNISTNRETQNVHQNSQIDDQISIPEDPSDSEVPEPMRQERVPTFVGKKKDPAFAKAENRFEALSGLRPKLIPDEIPPLVISGIPEAGEKARADFPTIMPATEPRVGVLEEIVVANVPVECSENLILHLFREYEPICIGPIKYTRSKAIPFCIVFFPTAQRAKAVKSVFDNRQLGGRNLIVLRAQNRMEN